MNKIDLDQLESAGEVLEEGTRVDHPESVMSNEDIPLTNSKFEFNYSLCLMSKSLVKAV